MTAYVNLQRVAREDQDDDVAKARRCLVCKESFASHWSGERICKKCKSREAWRTGLK